MVEWLSSIKAKNLFGCGKLVLTGDMSTLSITKIDLSSMNTLEGKLCCLKATLNSDIPCTMRSPMSRPTHPLLICLLQAISVRWQGRQFRS